MPAPVIVTVRSGVQFVAAAAASFRRVEAKLGRRMDINSTYRDYNKQLGMFNAWNAYVAGRGPYPGHSRALHPDASAHCKGLALDTDDWSLRGFIPLMAEHGWIRTAPNDLTERHHFEYQSWNDKHRTTPAGGGTKIIEPDKEDIDMSTTKYLYTRDAGDGKPAYGIFGEQVPGGSRISRSSTTAEVWGAMFGREGATDFGAPWKELTAPQWSRLQNEARVINEAWAAQVATFDYAKLSNMLALAVAAIAPEHTPKQIAEAVMETAAERLRN